VLVLTLYDGEAVRIGDEVKIVMDRCIDDGKSTRLAIDAPADMKVRREELNSYDIFRK